MTLARAASVAAFLLFTIATAASAQVTASRNLTLLANRNDYPPPAGGRGYASCWGYVHGDGREYALLGCANGTAIYNVTNPVSPYQVGFIPGISSTWREMKSYRNWVYVVTESYSATSPTGLQIIRMTNPEVPVLAATWSGSFNRAHTVSVDTARALLICNGTNKFTPPSSHTAMGLRVLSLANPEAPVEVGRWPVAGPPFTSTDYVHDSAPIGNRLYASSIYVGTERILDFTNPSNLFQISSWTYPGAFYTHNSWPDATGKFVYVTDEQNGQTLRVFDITNPVSPALSYEYTPNPNSIVHNAHVNGTELYLASYTEGTRVLDISDPAHPAEFAFSDSYPGLSGGFFGVWGVYPHFPSGTVISSDMQTGLYVYSPVRNYGIVRVRVEEAGAPLSGVTVRLTSQGDSLRTTADGVVVFAPNPGPHSVEVKKFGYYTATASCTVSPGSRDTLELSLVPRPLGDYQGTLRDAGSLGALEDAEVTLADSPLQDLTDSAGAFAFTGVPDDLYRVDVHAAGHHALSFERRIGPSISPTQDLRLLAAPVWHSFETATGWFTPVPGDDAVSGFWTRVEPLGTGDPAPGAGMIGRGASPEGTRPPLELEHGDGERGGAYPGEVQPEFDHTPPPGTLCFITGQGTTPGSLDENDVDGGRTSLISPSLNASGMTDPVIEFWRWFYGDGDANDWFAVFVSGNGTTFVPVDTLRGVHNRWEPVTVHLNQYVVPGPLTKIKFVAADLGVGTIVEAGVDDVILYDAAIPSVGVGPGAAAVRLAFRAPVPNPARGAVYLSVALPERAVAVVEILDLGGRRLATLHRGIAPAGTLALTWDGRDATGRLAPAGVYYARAMAGGETTETRFVRLR